MAFSMGCFACCVPCDPCDAVCDETPDEAFAVVYQVEDQRANLTWTGDAMGPIDGPWPGFENDPGPYTQEITSGSIVLPGSRFPCYFRLKLWRNVGGGEGSDALDNERVTISCTQGKVNLGAVVLSAGESLDIRTDPENSTATYVIDGTRIALDTNGGDRHAHPPAFWQVSGAALCADTIITVTASIQWSNDLIQHNLYGEFRECFDEQEGGCVVDCDGTSTQLPADLFLTISNSVNTAVGNGTHVLSTNDSLAPCYTWGDAWTIGAEVTGFATKLLHVRNSQQGGLSWRLAVVEIAEQDFIDLVCGAVGSLSGAGEYTDPVDPSLSISFDWELTL